MTTYTPGPWRYRTGETVFVVERDQPYPKDYHIGLVAKVSNLNGFAENEANAKLIAASPGLLEALKELLEEIHAYGRPLRGVIAKAEKAIAQAQEGK